MKRKRKNENKYCRKHNLSMLFGMMVVVVITLFVLLFKEKKSYGNEIENKYNMAMYQLIDNVQDIEVYLAKASISSSPKSSAETLTYVWRDANLAETYLSILPINSSEIEKTAKFLNQVSDYSYSLSRKAIGGESLTQEELDTIDKLHKYSVELKDTLNTFVNSVNSGNISWSELTNININNISSDKISAVEENFHEYAGLIYDGAFSEHMTNPMHKGLTGEDIDEIAARKIASGLIGDDRIKNISFEGLNENGSIYAYTYTIECKDNNLWWIAITKKGGHVLFINSDRLVDSAQISDEEASKKAEEYLSKNGFYNMKKTYYSSENGIETINFAYEEEWEDKSVIVYPDLIKVKVALDNGEILGLESTGYLNSHTERERKEIRISKEEAISSVNSNLNIEDVRLAIIPTEFQTEITCWEIKGKVEDRDFLVYVNVENGKEEDILMILNSNEGTLTM